MVAKKPSLAETVSAKTTPESVPSNQSRSKKPTTKKAEQRGRVGMKHVGGYYPPECLKAIKSVGLEEDMTIQEMTARAMNMFLESHGKAPVFPVD